MQSIASFLLITLPWLNPFSPGPSTAAVSLLFSWGCAGALLLLWAFPSKGLMPERKVDGVAAAWLVAALLSALMGLLQYFGATGSLWPWVDNTALGEAYANLRQRNQFATLTNIGLAALLWWVARDAPVAAGSADSLPGNRADKWTQMAAAMSVAALLAMGNAASTSRTGLAQLLLLLALAALWRGCAGGWRRAGPVLLAAALAYAVAAWTLPLLAGLDPSASGILSRLHDGGPACASRLTLWGNVLHLIGLKPWLGWGWGELDFAHFVTLYPGARFCEILDNAHNLPLHLAVELGVPLALLLCGGGLWLAWRAKPWREADATRQLAWSVVALILLHSMLEYPLWYGPFQMAFGLALWLLWRKPVSTLDEAAPRRLQAGLATVLIAFSAYAAWDYQRISQIYLPPTARVSIYKENTLEKIRGSWLFRDQVQFADLTTTNLAPDNAQRVHRMAQDMLHFSPEPRVVELLIESAVMLKLDEQAAFYLVRYQAAFPEAYARWAAKAPE
jgi:hypothetical protein